MILGTGTLGSRGAFLAANAFTVGGGPVLGGGGGGIPGWAGTLLQHSIAVRMMGYYLLWLYLHLGGV